MGTHMAGGRQMASFDTQNKPPLLTFRDLEESTVLAIKLNFLERGQILSSIGDAVSKRPSKRLHTEVGIFL
jgi:hypothetical protein